MTPLYDCCDKCKYPTYTQCLTLRPAPNWVCPADGLHCVVDCVAKHDPNRQQITTQIKPSGLLPSGGKLPGIFKPPIKCTKIETVNGKKCIKQLCVSLIQPTNGWIMVAENRYSTRSRTSPFFCPATFFMAAILLASGFGLRVFVSVCTSLLS